MTLDINNMPDDDGIPDHIVTPRDLRAEKLAAELEGKTGHKDPLTVAQQIEKITGRKQ